jgi:DNA-binding transcriptional LysR family regulator
MRSLNLDQMRALIQVIELGSFSAAARRLHLSQPAVSLQIRELEERCGVCLVERIGKRMQPTAAGSELIAYAQRIEAEADRALAAMKRHRDDHAGRVHLGSGPSAAAYLLPPVLEALRERYPNIELIITTGTTNDIAERIMANTLDLGLTALPAEGEDLDSIPVRTDDMVAILPATDTDIPPMIRPADVARRALILEYQRVPHPALSRTWLRAAGFDVKPALEFDSVEGIKNAVAAGLGMSLLPSPAVAHTPLANSIVVRPLDPPLIRTLGLVQHRNKPDNPALCAVRDEILATLSNIPVTASSSLAPGADADAGLSLVD